VCLRNPATTRDRRASGRDVARRYASSLRQVLDSLPRGAEPAWSAAVQEPPPATHVCRAGAVDRRLRGGRAPRRSGEGDPDPGPRCRSGRCSSSGWDGRGHGSGCCPVIDQPVRRHVRASLAAMPMPSSVPRSRMETDGYARTLETGPANPSCGCTVLRSWHELPASHRALDFYEDLRRQSKMFWTPTTVYDESGAPRWSARRRAGDELASNCLPYRDVRSQGQTPYRPNRAPGSIASLTSPCAAGLEVSVDTGHGRIRSTGSVVPLRRRRRRRTGRGDRRVRKAGSPSTPAAHASAERLPQDHPGNGGYKTLTAIATSAAQPAVHQARQDRGREVVAHPEPAYSRLQTQLAVQQPLRTGTLSVLVVQPYRTLGDQNRRGYRQAGPLRGRTALARAGTKRAAYGADPLARSYRSGE